MKAIVSFYLFCFFAASVSFSQVNISFEINFGNYINDHHEREFHAHDRTWTWNGKTLIYKITDRDVYYADTIELNVNQKSWVEEYIIRNKMEKGLVRVYENKVPNKHEMYQQVRGHIKANGKESEIRLDAQGFDFLTENKETADWMRLEQMFYEIIEQDRYGVTEQ